MDKQEPKREGDQEDMKHERHPTESEERDGIGEAEMDEMEEEREGRNRRRVT